MKREPQPRRIIWAVTKEEHAEGRKLCGSAICSNLNLLEQSPEAAVEVFILKGHKNTAACAAFYKKIGAEITMFDYKPTPKKHKDLE